MSHHRPWTDRQGRFSPLKALALAALAAPALWIGWRYATGTLSAKPIDAAILETGTWSVRFLLATLAVSPLRYVTGQTRLIPLRRLLGLGALAYGLVHLLLYVILQKWNLWTVASEIVLRFYLTIGFVSLAAMTALGATSFDGTIRRLGSARWNRLHRLVFPLTVLALLHAFLQSKIDISEEAVMAGIFLALLGVRLARRQFGLSPAVLAGIAVAAAALTIGLEVLWYATMTGVPWRRILDANWMLALQPRPGLMVLIWTSALPLLALALRLREAVLASGAAAAQKS